MVKRKKILIFTPGGVGGAERMSVLIGKMLPMERYEIKYVVIGRLKNIYNLFPEGYDVDCIPVRNIYCFSTFRIWRKIAKEQPDLVFVSQEAYNGRVIIASKLAGKKVIVRSSSMLGWYRKSLYKQVQLTYPKADKLIAQQEEMRAELLRVLQVNPEKVITLHNPIDIDNIKALSEENSPYPNEVQINFVNVASIKHVKAQDISIKAFSIVRNAIPNAHLYFVGGYDEKDESYKNELNALVSELGLLGCVYFVGYDKNPYKWVKNANCFILPSRIEGLPNALVEASYLGVPCVATRCLNIVDDIIKDGRNGYVVNVDDVEGMAEGMIKSLKLKDLEMTYKPATSEDLVELFESVLQ